MCKRFLLVRDEFDGVNQPGKAAEGVLFASGKVAICWTQRPFSVQTFDSITDVMAVQKQNRVTRIVWMDHEEKEQAVPRSGMACLQEAQTVLAARLGESHVLVSSESSRTTRMEFARERISSCLPQEQKTEV